MTPIFVLFFVAALPIALLMTGLSYLLTAHQRREQRAKRAQDIENSRLYQAEQIRLHEESVALDEARMRKAIEHAAQFGS